MFKQKNNKKFSEKHPLIFTLIFCFIFMLIVNIFFSIVDIYLNIKIIKKTTDFSALLKNCLDFLIFILTVVLFKCSKILKGDAKSFKKSFKGTYILFAIAFIFLILKIIAFIQKKQAFADGLKILLGILTIFTSAFKEEVIFRGVLANLLAFKHAQTKKGAYLTIFLSSFCFATMHFVNILTGAKISAVSFQVIDAFFFGALVTIVYFKYNHNIWVVSFWHTVLNCNGLFEVYFLKKTISFSDSFNKEKIVETLGYRFIFIAILIFICYLYLRKNAIEQIIKNINSFKNKFYANSIKKL